MTLCAASSFAVQDEALSVSCISAICQDIIGEWAPSRTDPYRAEPGFNIWKFEDRIAGTISQTQDIPGLIAETGAITVNCFHNYGYSIR